MMWWNSDDGVGGATLYIWYNDGNSTQWVPAAASATTGGVGSAVPPLVVTSGASVTFPATTDEVIVDKTPPDATSVILPSPTAGMKRRVTDGAGNADSYNITIYASDGTTVIYTIMSPRETVLLRYANATLGWGII
jgi:hypothetical protein